MDDDTEIPEPDRSQQTVAVTPGQFEQLTQLVSDLVARQRRLEGQFTELGEQFEKVLAEEERRTTQPAPWVWFPPPAFFADPRATVRAFVEFYNVTYVGKSDGRAQRIPDCWEQHPGLAMEVANLVMSWRAANIGKRATPRDAQYWHQQWRPGAIDRMVGDWVHPDCLDGDHKPVGARARQDRFTATEVLRVDRGGES